MATHTSATAQEETPHDVEITVLLVSDATRRRAESVINDITIDSQWRATIRAALELNDPSLAELVLRAEANEDIVDTFESLQTPERGEDDSTASKIEALAEIICRSGDETTAALFILLEMLESSMHPKDSASRAKHIAFSRCGDLHVYKMVEDQIAVAERQLLTTNTLES